MPDLRVLQKRVWVTAEESGFHDPGTNTKPAAWCANLHGEVSELWEAYREGKLDQPCDKADKMRELELRPLNCAEEELADLVIRAMDIAEQLGLDLESAIVVKDAYNQTRPWRHGGKKA